MDSITRREFLRTSGWAGLGLALKPSPPAGEPNGDDVVPLGPVTHWDGSPLGRILLNVMTVYEKPSWKAPATGDFLLYDDVVEVQEAVGGEGLYTTNHTWLRIKQGFIYSSWVQPVAYITYDAFPVGDAELWGQVMVPIAEAKAEPDEAAPRRHYLYYSTVNRIIGLENNHYLIREIYGYEYWVKAAHMRIVTPEEVAPISPHVSPDDKRIQISIRQQRLFAYEGDIQVFSAPISSGMPSTPTPFGEYRVIDKRHGQRMTGGLGDSAYNQPGIPWVCYFSYKWIATHGVYWHNDFGRLHSNGCINLLPEAAKWIFRWTTPAANYYAYNTETTSQTEPGTRIVVGA